MNGTNDARLIEQGDPSADPKGYRACLGQYGTGVAVITAFEEDGALSGMTVNSLASVSLDPPLILWSLRTASRSLPVFTNSKGFVVNVLAANQIKAAHHFADSERNRDADIEYVQATLKPPLLNGAVAHFQCSIEKTISAGDHVIIVGRVHHFVRCLGKPLLFVQGQYGTAASHPEFVSGITSREPTEQEDSSDLIAEIFEARNRLSREFEAHRQAEYLGIGEARVLRRVEEAPRISREDLLDRTFLGERQFDDATRELMELGWLAVDSDGRFTLSDEGLRRRRAVKRRWRDFQKAQTKGIPKGDLETARAVLQKIVAAIDSRPS